MGSTDVAYSLAHLGRIYADRGDLALARAAYEEAVARCEGPQDVQGLVPALAGLALTLATDDPEAAERLASRAVGYGPGMAHVDALLAAGWVALAHGGAMAASKRALEAGAEARSRRDRVGLAQSLELSALADPSAPGALEAAAQAVALWSELRSPAGTARAEFLAAIICKDSGRADAAASALSRLGVRSHLSFEHLLAKADLRASSGSGNRPSLSVQTLGRFRVIVDEQPLPASSWQSRKARDLLKVLVARRGRPVPRDELMDLLWPEEAGEKVANRLSVALSTLRAVLDPAKRGSSNHFVVSDRDVCRLDLVHADVEVERFPLDAASGLALVRNRDPRAGALLRRAESTYTGDFLEENAYEDWAVALRDEARGAYLRTCRALAEQAVAEEDTAEASRYLRRLLERDTYDEAAHLHLVQVLLQARQHGEAHRAYRNYASRMSEMGVEAVPFPDPSATKARAAPRLMTTSFFRRPERISPCFWSGSGGAPGAAPDRPALGLDSPGAGHGATRERARVRDRFCADGTEGYRVAMNGPVDTFGFITERRDFDGPAQFLPRLLPRQLKRTAVTSVVTPRPLP